mmetsp:Transcript_11748/g.34701  ORF Transcript_11748/g.34701 Transcript_11748/m.34701 type:complete len:100 (-) Transcript_11748:48-347(-)
MDRNFTTNSSFTTWKGSPPADAMSGTDASGSLDIDARPAPRLVGVADAVPPVARALARLPAGHHPWWLLVKLAAARAKPALVSGGDGWLLALSRRALRA